LIYLAVVFFFTAAFLFIYSLFLLKPFTRKRKHLLRFAYLLSFAALVMVLYSRGYLTPLLIASFLSLLLSYIAWEVSLYFLRR